MCKRCASLEMFFAFTVALLAFPLLTTAQTNQSSPPLKVTKLIGMKVEDIDGQKDGTVHDLVFDTRTGQLKFVVIASGGFLGVRSTLKLVPPQAMSAATTKRNTLAVGVTTEQWERAPTFKPSDLPSLAPDRSREIAHFYQHPEIHIANTIQRPLNATGRDTGRHTNAPTRTLKFASDLIDARVVNRSHEKIGQIRDLLVSFRQPNSPFAIISTGRFLRRGNQYAIPLSALSPLDTGALAADADNATLQRAPSFSPQVWEAANGSDKVYQYPKTGD